MKKVLGPNDYQTFEIDSQTSHVIFHDCMGGFDSNYRSPVLDRLVQVTNSRPLIVQTEYLPNDRIRNNYPSLDIQFDIEQHLNVLGQFYQYAPRDKL
jgi:hypothetical protein